MPDPTPPTPYPLWRRPPFGASLFIAAAMVAIITYLRLFVATDRVVPVAYGVPLVFCIWFRSRSILWGMVVAFTIITAIKYFVMLQAAGSLLIGGRFVSWAMIEADLLLVAAIVHVALTARDALERRSVELEVANRDLRTREADVERQNEELRQQSEELQAQAEELQAQAEELERSGEELRVTNAELEHRERLLERLLELSQSLTADLSREQVMQRVCDAVDAVVGMPGAVAAALEEQEGAADFRVAASWGIEPVDALLPAGRTLAALVLERGQSGYVEDLEKRPDLMAPRPRFGPPLRSVLAAPLRLERGRRGTIEVYTREPHAWTRQQVVMLEALAHQASTSLANVGLVDEMDRQRRWLETVVRTLPVGVIVTDHDARTLRLNQAAARMHGGDPNVDFPWDPKTLGWHLELNGTPLRVEETPLFRAARDGDETRGLEIELVVERPRPGDAPEAIPIRINKLVAAAPIRDRANAIIGAVSTIVDITQLKALQRELDQRRRDAEEASVRKTRFLAAVSHDIRTPANAINLLAELMAKAAESPTPEFLQEASQLAGELQSAALSLVHLVSDVLDVTRYDYGKVELQATRFPLGQFIEDHVRQHRPVADAKGIELIVRPVDPALALHTDAVKLGRALTNLIGNAIKFTERGSVTVSAADIADGGVALEVTDTGIGMATEHLPRIFDEFFQIQNPARDRTKGTGLGLAICHRLVLAMDGRLDVRSRLGHGSTFAITLPPSAVAAAPAAAALPAAPAAKSDRPLAGRRILLVEDHDLTRHAIARILARQGAAVSEAPDGATARAPLEGHDHFDALLLDMMLPDVDGREILRHLDGKRPASLQAVVVLTGDVTAERTAEVQRLGADLLMHKPIDPNAIVQYLRDQLVK